MLLSGTDYRYVVPVGTPIVYDWLLTIAASLKYGSAGERKDELNAVSGALPRGIFAGVLRRETSASFHSKNQF